MSFSLKSALNCGENSTYFQHSTVENNNINSTCIVLVTTVQWSGPFPLCSAGTVGGVRFTSAAASTNGRLRFPSLIGQLSSCLLIYVRLSISLVLHYLRFGELTFRGQGPESYGSFEKLQKFLCCFSVYTCCVAMATSLLLWNCLKGDTSISSSLTGSGFTTLTRWVWSGQREGGSIITPPCCTFLI